MNGSKISPVKPIRSLSAQDQPSVARHCSHTIILVPGVEDGRELDPRILILLSPCPRANLPDSRNRLPPLRPQQQSQSLRNGQVSKTPVSEERFRTSWPNGALEISNASKKKKPSENSRTSVEPVAPTPRRSPETLTQATSSLAYPGAGSPCGTSSRRAKTRRTPSGVLRKTPCMQVLHELGVAAGEKPRWSACTSQISSREASQLGDSSHTAGPGGSLDEE